MQGFGVRDLWWLRKELFQKADASRMNSDDFRGNSGRLRATRRVLDISGQAIKGAQGMSWR